MARQRGLSNASSSPSLLEGNQELESMYDYLAKVILLGPSGAGKSCVLHRFVKDEWRVLSSQTIGVEFSSKIVRLGTGPRRTRIKLQLWDTAGTERFRSVSRSYYRGAAGAILIYDISSHASFTALPTFLMDARALASPNLTVLLAGNKADLGYDSLTHSDFNEDNMRPPPTPSSTSSKQSSFPLDSVPGSVRSTSHFGTGTRLTATYAPDGREVGTEEAAHWAAKSNIPVAVEVSALTGEGVEELFHRLARIILTKIELGEIDPDDPQSGIQYGDGGLYGHGTSDGSSIRSRMTIDDNAVQLHRRNTRRQRGNGGVNNWRSGMGEWEEVFRSGNSPQKRGAGCC
ncbi:putative Ras family GTPase (Rab4b) [Aspergillus clavatus NRRL 1]|uniref:Rab n=1 Tax=Aspergillus clavatus (strain ATCC 1007 / CBS 513.65 / DSM 816 / NCTC 3887 / NRRL 1 / QM 1276 / 107) TaxID=344612 RepID=A1CFY9_ASPCL|nr:rab [Aspergillus clavatus NRRL 1]EAW10869.1 rab [Aspergillus clavatus NRRL 1]